MNRDPMARPLVSNDRPDPIQVWSTRLDLALFVLGILAILFIVVVLAPGGPA